MSDELDFDPSVFVFDYPVYFVARGTPEGGPAMPPDLLRRVAADERVYVCIFTDTDWADRSSSAATEEDSVPRIVVALRDARNLFMFATSLLNEAEYVGFDSTGKKVTICTPAYLARIIGDRHGFTA